MTVEYNPNAPDFNPKDWCFPPEGIYKYVNVIKAEVLLKEDKKELDILNDASGIALKKLVDLNKELEAIVPACRFEWFILHGAEIDILEAELTRIGKAYDEGMSRANEKVLNWGLENKGLLGLTEQQIRTDIAMFTQNVEQQ